jgi:hypothetical protein
MDNQIKELEKDELDIISEYTTKCKLHPNFLPVTTYDMVQCGYPTPTAGIMIARGFGGTDKEDRLLPSNGMWCKVEDVEKLRLNKYSDTDMMEFAEWCSEHGYKYYKIQNLWANNWMSSTGVKNTAQLLQKFKDWKEGKQ